MEGVRGCRANSVKLEENPSSSGRTTSHLPCYLVVVSSAAQVEIGTPKERKIKCVDAEGETVLFFQFANQAGHANEELCLHQLSLAELVFWDLI